MKKKDIIIIVSFLIVVMLISLITLFVINMNEDKKIMEQNIKIINESYENIKKEVENYNNIRNNISIFINNFYYDTIEDNYSNNLEVLNNYDGTINKITKEIEVLNSKCNSIYKEQKINNICNNYKNDYEVIVNVFMNDINNYNNKLNLYNKDNEKQLNLFKSNYINDYIDYNKDSIFSKKDEVNEEE